MVRVPAGGGPQTTVPTTGLSQPTGLALSRGGELYIADSGNDRVVKVPAAGGRRPPFPPTGLKIRRDWPFDADGNLYIADFGNDRVVKVRATGGGRRPPSPSAGLTHPRRAGRQLRRPGTGSV